MVDEIQELLVKEMRASDFVKQKVYSITLLNVLTGLCKADKEHDKEHYSAYTHLTAIQWIVTLLEVILIEREIFMNQPIPIRGGGSCSSGGQGCSIRRAAPAASA